MRYYQGVYKPKNIQKYIGKTYPIYRSSYELKFFQFCDTNINVIKWASELITIPYFNPVLNRKANYTPDILITYKDKFGIVHTELIEIKPLTQTVIEAAKSKSDAIAYYINQAKWSAARIYCTNNKITFRVVTENELFGKYSTYHKRRK